MANEIDTGASAGEMIQAEILSNEIIEAAYAPSVMFPLVRRASLVGQPTLTGEYTKDPKLSASTLTDGTAASNAAYDPTSVTVSTAEIGLVLEQTDLHREGSILDPQHLAMIAGSAVGEQIDTDLIAEFADFTLSVGSTGVNTTNANLLSAVYNYKNSNMLNYGQAVGVLHPIQIFDWWTDVAALTGTVVGAESFGAAGPFNVNRGFTIYGVEFFESTLCASVNTNADRQGAVFPRGQRCPIIYQLKRAPRVEMERDAKMRSWSAVVTEAHGDENVDIANGVAIITDHE